MPLSIERSISLRLVPETRFFFVVVGLFSVVVGEVAGVDEAGAGEAAGAGSAGAGAGGAGAAAGAC